MAGRSPALLTPGHRGISGGRYGIFPRGSRQKIRNLRGWDPVKPDMNPSIIPSITAGRSFWPATCVSALLCGGLALMGGCSSGPESHVVSAPPPPAPTTQVVVTQPQAYQTQAYQPQAYQAVPMQTSAGTIIVQQAPPAIQQESISAQPSSDHKWIQGYWTWSSSNSRYEWVSGHWELPPTRGAVWVAPRWERTDRGAFRFYEGYWN